MHPTRPCLPLLLALLLPLGASAFSVPNHEALTRAAIDAALAEGPHAELARHRAILLEATQAEDLNLHVKWTGWNHFYHPGATLDSTFRKDSSARVRALWEEAQEAASNGELDRAFDRVGHLVHHIQDMASPPHVVPVMHGLSDGFEGQPLGHQALTRHPVRAIAPLSGEDAQLALARETLEVVRTESLPVHGGAIPWSAFWAEPTTPAPGLFGGYGSVSNAFGASQVRWRGRTWKVERSAYEAFLEARTEAAVAYSRAFLVWATQRITTLAQSRNLAVRTGWTPSAELAVEAMGGALATARGATPVAGLRLLAPLPGALALSASYARPLGIPMVGAEGVWSLSLLSPPLLTARLGYGRGLALRASAGAGLSSLGGRLHPELPVGLRLNARVGGRLLLSAEAQYRLFSPTTAPWSQGVSLTLGTGFTWGDT